MEQEEDDLLSFRDEQNDVVHFVLDSPFAGRQNTTLHLARTLDHFRSRYPRSIVVKLIRFQETDSAIAIAKAEKFKKKHWDNDDGKQTRLVDLCHPNVLRYFAADILKPTAVPDSLKARLIMEHCKDGDLARALNKESFDMDKVVFYTRQILSGLAYLHRVRTIHADIKPHNIFLTTENSATVLKLGDLDDRVQLVKTITGSEVKQLVGTLLYMSPEMIDQDFQLMENKLFADVKPGRSTDIWSTGCVVLDMYMVSTGVGWRCISKSQPLSSGEPEMLLASVGKKDTTENVATGGWDQQTGAPVDGQFLRNYILGGGSGFIPQYPRDIPADLREFLDKCFQINPGCRPVAEVLLNHRFVATARGALPGR